ncbi:MAG: YtxH domain-containing protein [Chloroflexi bacterium]|nr:YtxH domain-containing protein [Chloroflexota bacterium]
MAEENATSGFGIGFLVGAVVGAVLGLALAPRSGSETREQVREQAGAAFDKLREKMAELKKNGSKEPVVSTEEE